MYRFRKPAYSNVPEVRILSLPFFHPNIFLLSLLFESSDNFGKQNILSITSFWVIIGIIFIHTGDSMKRFLKLSIITFLLLAILLSASVYTLLRLSRAKYDGEVGLSGLNKQVVVERDNYGVPIIKADNRLDASRAMGYLHAQERYFQMDLLRRKSAGELSEIIGPKTLDVDKKIRLHQLRKHSKEIISNMPEAEIAILEAYTEGVNTGLDDLKVKPWEYFLLSSEPKEWLMEDSILVSYIIFIELQDKDAVIDVSRGYMQEILGEEVYNFMIDNGSSWDSPLDSSKTTLPTLPMAAHFRQALKASAVATKGEMEEERAKGSNNWVVGGDLTADGSAMVACDMHLSLGVPNIWYRTSLMYTEGSQACRIDGITLPGTPFMIMGSNENVAWGFTSSFVNISDAIIIEEEDGQYKTPEGSKDFEVDIEKIYIKGEEEPLEYEITNTIWGPILEEDYFGKKIAVKWVGHDNDCMDLGLLKLERVKNTRQAIDLVKTLHMPTLSFVAGDKEGNIGWTFTGFLPKRKGYNGYLPVSFADGKASWLGRRSPEEYPEIYNPDNNILFTANNRLLSGKEYEYIGDGGYKNPARAYQIKSKLQAITDAKEEDLLSIQMDYEARYLRRWQELFLDTLSHSEYFVGYPLEELKQVAADWNGYADSSSEAYYLIRTFYSISVRNVLQRIFSPCLKVWDGFNYSKVDYEEQVWTIIKEQPKHLLSLSSDNWQEELSQYIIEAYEQCSIDGELLPWSAENTLNIQHPISKAAPILGRWIDMPKWPVSGDLNTPKLSRPDQGASQRMVVSPGGEERAIFHMPGGQSGNPISPYYKKGHEDWYYGRKSALINKNIRHKLILNP